ncbi:MAG: PAS domain S-box protein, partial [Mariprofundaceae bacterium]|nr:PAS domain S-box protein [Mariprofundaceae bacterium]
LRDDVKSEAIALAHTQIAGLKTLMLHGDGQLVSEWMGRMAGQADIEQLRVFRRNGEEAFTDLSTIKAVNRYLGDELFQRPINGAMPGAAPSLQNIRQAVAGSVLLDDPRHGHFSLLMPIQREDACLHCHGYEDDAVRGVLFIQLSTVKDEASIVEFRHKALVFSALFAIVLLLVTWALLQGLVLSPMTALLGSIRRLYSGEITDTALPQGRKDEFGALARAFAELEAVWAIRERRLQLILQHIPDGVLTVNHEGKVITTNQAAQGMFGCTPEELIAHNVLDNLYPSSRATRQDVPSLSQQVELEQLADTVRECVGQAKDQSLFPMELEVLPFHVDYMMFMRERAMFDLDEHGEFLIFLRDLTVRKRAEGEMRLLSAVVNQASDAILITDPSGLIEYVNHAFYRITQFSREEVIGKKPSILKGGEYDDSYYKRMWTDLLAGKVWKDVFVNQRKDGSSYHAEQTIAPIFDGYGHVSHFVSIQRDITRERDLQAQMEHLQRLESLGVLASGIAHDFNNILAVVMGNAELLAIGFANDSPQKSSLDAIVGASTRGAGLCRELMAYAGKGKCDVEWVNLKTLFDELSHLLQVTVPRHVEMHFELADDLPLVKADSMQLEQVIMNLLINAKEAIGSQHGSIQVSGEKVQLERNDLEGMYFDQLPDSLTFVRLTVQDDGCGMSDKVRCRIFDPFYTTKFTGRGLGMSAVLGIIQSHQGAIQCESQLYEGTKFTLLIPVTVHDTPTIDAPIEQIAPTTVQNKNRETILVVEDEQAIRDVLQQLLNHADYHVRAHADGESALQDFTMHQTQIDLVMLDMSMPVMSGPQLLGALRKAGLTVPVVVCSGEAKDDVLKKLGDLHVDAIVSKPFQYQALLRLLRELHDGVPH